MRRLTGGVTLALAVALGAAACDNKLDTPAAATGPTVTVTESFAGSLTPSGAVTYFFTTTAAGPLTATILTLTPDGSTSLGLALGTWNGATCQTTIANDRAGQGTTVTGNVSGAGSVCVRIYDANGVVPATEQFEIVVVHP
jgi:hypothetical protein